MTAIKSSIDPMEILHELKMIAPDVWESDNRRLILPQRLGDFERTEYVEGIQNMLSELNRYIGMLNTGLISEIEYESKKAGILSSMQGS